MRKIIGAIFIALLIPSSAFAWPTFSSDSFLGLTDAPDSYLGESGNCVAVNGTETGLEFTACGSGGGAPTDATYLTLSTNATLTNERVLTEGTALDITDAGAGSTLTVSWDSTEVEATTWGAGGNASNAWTFNLSGTDPVLTFSSGAMALTGNISATNLSGTNTGDVTLAGTPDYITISGQVITRGTIDIGDDTNLAGTSNEITLTGDTLSLSTTIDLGGKTSFEIPNAAAPTTDAFGEMAGDNNAWAASRGAVQFYDGTANTYLVGALSSDTPSNGQVPTWNTGGTVTWETPSGGTTTQIGGASSVTSFSATNYIAFYGGDSNSSEATRDYNRVPVAMTVTAVTACVNAAPGVGNSWVVTLKEGGSATTVTTTISGTNVCSTTSSLAEAISASNDLVWEFAETGTAASTTGQSVSWTYTT